MKLSVYERKGGGLISPSVLVGSAHSGLLQVDDYISKIYPRDREGVFRGFDLEGESEEEIVFLKSLPNHKNELLLKQVLLAAESLFQLLKEDRFAIEIDLLPGMIGVDSWAA